MPHPNEGARNARRVIRQFQKQLNSPHLVPAQCYRMSSGSYGLVCFVNQVTALYLSRHHALIPLFLARSHRALLNADHAKVSAPYRQLVLQYLGHMAHYIVDHGGLGDDEDDLIGLIPPALIALTPGPLPEDLLRPGDVPGAGDAPETTDGDPRSPGAA